MANKPLLGKQLHQQFKRSEWVQGVECPRGSSVVLPITLADKPQSRQAVRVFLGTVGGGRGRLVVLGLDFDVDLDSRSVTWLATARWALLVSNELTIDYYTKGITA
jgi:hypothetical protein